VRLRAHAPVGCVRSLPPHTKRSHMLSPADSVPGAVSVPYCRLLQRLVRFDIGGCCRRSSNFRSGNKWAGCASPNAGSSGSSSQGPGRPDGYGTGRCILYILVGIRRRRRRRRRRPTFKDVVAAVLLRSFRPWRRHVLPNCRRYPNGYLVPCSKRSDHVPRHFSRHWSPAAPRANPKPSLRHSFQTCWLFSVAGINRSSGRESPQKNVRPCGTSRSYCTRTLLQLPSPPPPSAFVPPSLPSLSLPRPSPPPCLLVLVVAAQGGRKKTGQLIQSIQPSSSKASETAAPQDVTEQQSRAGQGATKHPAPAPARPVPDPIAVRTYVRTYVRTILLLLFSSCPWRRGWRQCQRRRRRRCRWSASSFVRLGGRAGPARSSRQPVDRPTDRFQ
jgi:hypothetical protein